MTPPLWQAEAMLARPHVAPRSLVAALLLALPVLAALLGRRRRGGRGRRRRPRARCWRPASRTSTTTSGVDLTLATDDLPDGVHRHRSGDRHRHRRTRPSTGDLTVVFARPDRRRPGDRRRRQGLRPAPVHPGLDQDRPRRLRRPRPGPPVERRTRLRAACSSTTESSRRARASAAAPTTPRCSPPTPARCPARR